MNFAQFKRQPVSFDGINDLGSRVGQAWAIVPAWCPLIKSLDGPLGVVVAQCPAERRLNQMDDGSTDKKADDDTNQKPDRSSDQAGSQFL